MKAIIEHLKAEEIFTVRRTNQIIITSVIMSKI